MIIHEVKEGETLQSIAIEYGVSVQRLVQINGIDHPEYLVPGLTIIILYSDQVHIVQEGDSLASIAEDYNISIKELLRNNPFLPNREYIYPGEELVIHFDVNRAKSITVNGYAYPHIDPSVLRKTLPYLTYLTIFHYQINSDGSIDEVGDLPIIQMSKMYGVAPIMLLSPLGKNMTYDETEIHDLLNDQEAQNILIDNALSILKAKGFYGLTLDFPYVSPRDRQRFMDLVESMTNRLNREGFIMNINISPTTFEVQSGLIFSGIDYPKLGEITDGTILLSYQWGLTYGPPIALYSFETITRLLSFAVTQIPPEKITIGIPIIGYRWKLPYFEGDIAESISLQGALAIAHEFGATIQYDTISESAFFQYSENSQDYIVAFKDARSIDVRLNLVTTYDCRGISIWNIMQPMTQIYMMIHAMFDIEEVIESTF